MIRRALVTTDTVGGVWSHTVDLARGLARHGVSVGLVAIGRGPSDAQRRTVAAVPGASLHQLPYELEWRLGAADDVARTCDALPGVARELGAELVHVNGYAYATARFGVPVVLGAHSCVTSWWHAVHRTAPPAEWDDYRRRVAAGLDAADAVVAPTRWMAGELGRRYGLRSAVHVVPNGVWVDDLGHGDEDGPFVLAAGRLWDGSKNVEAVVDVAPSLRWPVWIAGEGEGRNAPGVEWLGPLPRAVLQRRMRLASVFVHPARYEPFGLAPLEAAARGCALVLGDIPSLREVWGDAALYVAPDDRGGLAHALEALIEDTALRRSMQDAARQRASRFRAQRMAAAMLTLYRGLVGAAPEPAGAGRPLAAGPR